MPTMLRPSQSSALASRRQSTTAGSASVEVEAMLSVRHPTPVNVLPEYGSVEHLEWIARRLSRNLKLRDQVASSIAYAARSARA